MSEVAEVEQPKKTYGLKPQNYFILIGILLIIVGLTISPTPIAPGILLIVVTLLNNRLEVVRIYEKYSEIKLGAAAPRRLIKNSSIRDVTVEKNTFILTIDENDKEKKIKIALKSLLTEDGNELVEYYKSLI